VVIINRGQIVAEDTPKQLSARLRRSEKISVTVRNAPSDLANRVQSVPGVQHVTSTADPATLMIECELGHDLRDEVARYIVQNGWSLLELKTVSMTLEDVFLRLTQHEEGLAKTEINQ
jgi:ABC-2 type transport system ATP-binding protein